MKATLFDYGAGNLHSLSKALTRFGATVEIETDPLRCAQTDLLVLPGVGAFGPAAQRLSPGVKLLTEAIDAGLPVLGICLGMQLLFEESVEGPGRGLALFGGRVTRLQCRRVPHIGWNTLEEVSDPLLDCVGPDEVYFAHSFVCRPDSNQAVVAWTRLEGDRFPSAVRRENVLGLQFHPEKSSKRGLALLEGFLGEVGR